MGAGIILIVLATLIAAAGLTGLVRRFSISSGLLDVPNARSSHAVPTPRGGGIAIVLTSTVAAAVLVFMGVAEYRLLVVLAGGGLAVALVGYIDDRYGAPARVRLAVHFAAAVLAIVVIDLPELQIGTRVLSLGWFGLLWGTLAVVWALNLFNFMDGIDGIAASEAVFITSGGTLIAILSGTVAGADAVNLAVGAACLGFLLWNWPPAKIFMGDVGSGYMGYTIAVLSLVAGHQNPAGLWVWLILGGVFFADATVTLVRRLARGERLFEAHRIHAYQWLARRWGSHRRVTVTMLIVNVGWLLPLGLFAATHPRHAMWIALGALTPIVIGVAVAGAGRSEHRP